MSIHIFGTHLGKRFARLQQVVESLNVKWGHILWGGILFSVVQKAYVEYIHLNRMGGNTRAYDQLTEKD